MKIGKYEDLNNTEIIFKVIRWYEYQVEEDFIDQNETIVRSSPFASWLLGKGYINNKQMNSFLEERFAGIQSLLGGYDEEYCIFPYGECELESTAKRYHLLAEYIANIDVLRKRLFNVLLELEEPIILEEDEFFKVSEGEEIETVHDEWIFVNKNTIEEVNKIIMSRQ